MSDQRDVFEIIDRMGKRIAEEYARSPPTQMQLQEVELEGHPCSSCGRYSYPEPTTCYWCRKEAP